MLGGGGRIEMYIFLKQKTILSLLSNKEWNIRHIQENNVKNRKEGWYYTFWGVGRSRGGVRKREYKRSIDFWGGGRVKIIFNRMLRREEEKAIERKILEKFPNYFLVLSEFYFDNW